MKDVVDAHPLTEAARAQLLARPEAILEDREVMRALVAADDARLGDNVVDMRGLAMQRLEERLDRLEDTHRSVISAAYENLAGTEMIHRAVLEIVEAQDFAALVALLGGPLPEMLRIDRIVLVIEDAAPARNDGPLRRAVPGFVVEYLARGSRALPRRVTLRPIEGDLYGPGVTGSEACLTLDLGGDRLPAMLCLAVADPNHYHAGQGTDLLAFLAEVVERVLRRWP